MSRGREKRYARVRAGNLQLDPALLRGKGLVGHYLQAKCFCVELQRDILVANRYANKLDASDHSVLTLARIARRSSAINQVLIAVVLFGIAMPLLDDYIIDVLMRDLVGHDHKPVSFLVYLWLVAEQARTKREIRASYQQVAESVGISKSSAQSAIRWLLRRKLLSVEKQNVTATPLYTVRMPWRESARHQISKQH